MSLDAPPPRLILASGSPQRQRLLAQAGYQFEVVPPRAEAERGLCSQCGPAELVTELAVSKAADVAAQLDELAVSRATPHLILACDTVAECGGAILGKPRDEDHARSMLERLRGNVHRVYSGVCALLWPGDEAVDEPPSVDVRLAVSELEMDAISEAALEDYLASGLWADKAGAFGFQDRPGWLRLTSGSESNVIGLPMDIVPEMLARRRIRARN